jgi:transcriptional regulator of acetoin/glycerol metabolism
MQPFSSLPATDYLLDIRTTFLETKQIAATLDPMVGGSWKRSAPRLHPESLPHWNNLTEAALARTLLRSSLLCTMAQPILEDIRQFTESMPLAILLLDNTMCVLEMLGDKATTGHLVELGFRQGVFLREGQIGTNAFAIAQIERMPAWVYGPEHYLSCFHSFSTVAAPIHEPDGSLLGIVGTFEPIEQASALTVGLATTTAKAIESRIQSEEILQEASAYAIQINNIIDAMSEGLLVWDENRTVIHLNLPGSDLLKIRPTRLMGRHLEEVIKLPEIIVRASERSESLTDIECTVMVDNKPLALMVNFRVVTLPRTHLFLASFRPIEQVRELVSRQVGAVARQTVDNLIGESSQMKSLRRQIKTAARAEAPVLIQGETGTGKATIARAIHNSGPRKDGPFVAINCRAIPRDLILAEFIGFEAGSYTNINHGGQPSKFELAEGGTLYLDEIDILPLDMQAALLGVLDTGSVMRLGAKHAIPVNVRIVASTEVNLDDLVIDGGFRTDLYYRLRSFHIHTTPLRERREDIPILVRQKLMLLSSQIGQSLSFSEEAVEALSLYQWPGNIRELESMLDRAVAISEDTTIGVEHLPTSLLADHTGQPGVEQEPVVSMAEAERRAIVNAGRATGGNLTQAAAVLGIGRTTLWRKMNTMNLTVEDFFNSDHDSDQNHSYNQG